MGFKRTMITFFCLFPLLAFIFVNPANGQNDEMIKKEIREQLFWDNRVNAANIDVIVLQGTVTLTGTVTSYTAKRAAALDAWTVPGVDDVKNLIKVRYPEGAVTEDRVIRERIRNILIWNAALESVDIKVEVSGGIVTLRGTADAFWKKSRAEQVAASVTGVIAVVNQLGVVPTENVSDEMIARDIMQAMARNRNIIAENVDVKVTNGKVVLHGVVQDQEARESAESIAQYTAGVRDVENRLRLKQKTEE
jgi:osmotically-inducible protein OsmY